MTLLLLLVSLLQLTNAQIISARREFSNLGMEEGSPGAAPAGWMFGERGRTGRHHVVMSTDRPKEGRSCALVESSSASGPADSGILTQQVDASRYRARRVQIEAALRKADTMDDSRVQLFARVGDANADLLAEQNLDVLPLLSEDWRDLQVVIDVDDEAATLSLGLRVFGQGKIWIDHVRVNALQRPLYEAPRAFKEVGLANVTAFVRLLGYIQYFHPSDEAFRANWEALSSINIERVEKASGAVELARTLTEIFQPVAPTLQVFSGTKPPAKRSDTRPQVRSSQLAIVSWSHVGYGNTFPYESKRLRRTIDPATKDSDYSLESTIVKDLGAGVSAAIPIKLLADAAGTLPHSKSTQSSEQAILNMSLSARDRRTRLAAVALFWNAIQHFFPYFDVVETDWHASLRRALISAAVDESELAFLNTLRIMAADLHDTHCVVTFVADRRHYRPPFSWAWIEDSLVLTHVDKESPPALHVGDIVLKINGKKTSEALLPQERMVSGANPEWIRRLALQQIRLGTKNSNIALEVRNADGNITSISVQRTLHSEGSITEPRPPALSEIGQGIQYVDLTKVSDDEFEKASAALAKAQAVIMDLRGYPRGFVASIQHIIDKPVQSSLWLSPVISLPDHEGVDFKREQWTREPKNPHIGGRIALLTDDRALSRTETLLSIVEQYRLGSIVGEATAGTNGNNVTIVLPGGYHAGFTAMKVLKHDGSRFHGVGIQPTIKVKRTIKGVREGRDEVLERAIQELRHTTN